MSSRWLPRCNVTMTRQQKGEKTPVLLYSQPELISSLDSVHGFLCCSACTPPPLTTQPRAGPEPLPGGTRLPDPEPLPHRDRDPQMLRGGGGGSVSLHNSLTFLRTLRGTLDGQQNCKKKKKRLRIYYFLY